MARATRRQMQLAVDRFREWKRQVAALQNGTAEAAGRALSDYAAELFRIVGAGTHPNGAAIRTREELNAIIDEAQRAMDTALRTDQASIFRGAFSAIEKTMRISHNGSNGIYAAFGRTTLEQLEAAWNLYEQTKREAVFSGGFASWTSKFVGQEGGLLREEIRKAMGQIMQTGGGQRELAAQLLKNPLFNFKNLPPVGPRGMSYFTSAGRLTEAEALIQRANLIASTEITGVTNMMHMGWTSAAEFELYLNVNPEPVSEACFSATAQGAMTLADWAKWSERTDWPYMPPRHPRCDSTLMAVPSDYEEVSRQIDEVLAAASAAADEAVPA